MNICEESKVLDLRDFYFNGDDYRYRFELEAKLRFIHLLREQFNLGVTYKSRVLKWVTVIEQRTVELGRYLAGRTTRIDFSEPSPSRRRTDDRTLRKRILNLSQSEAQKLGIRSSTLHYLHKRAKAERSLSISRKVKEKIFA